MKSNLFLILVFFTYSCTTKSAVEDDFDDSILVQIDDYIILKNEFIQNYNFPSDKVHVLYNPVKINEIRLKVKKNLK